MSISKTKHFTGPCMMDDGKLNFIAAAGYTAPATQIHTIELYRYVRVKLFYLFAYDMNRE